MKKLFTSLLVFIAISYTAVSQDLYKLNGYKYAWVQPLYYQNGTKWDVWGINSQLRKLFGDKGFIVLSDDAMTKAAATQDPCAILSCYIDHTAVTYGTNYVSLTLKDCNGNVVMTTKGGGMGLTLQDDYNTATRKAFQPISEMRYSYAASLTPELNLPSVEMTTETETSIKEYLTSNKLDPIEGIYKSYQSESLSYYKIGIVKKGDGFKAIIIEAGPKQWKAGEVKAYFEPSSMNNLYSVKWYLANKSVYETFCTMENDGILTVELKNPNTGEKHESNFIKMYPSVSDNVTFKKDDSKASGSGFFITTNGYIATNAHVVEGASNVDVSVPVGSVIKTYKASVVLTDEKNDVALLKISDESFKGLTLIPYAITQSADVGEKVFTIGYPLNDVMGTNYKVTDGIISSKTGIADDVRYFQISVPLQPGNSGGPLFNKQGNVIGLTSARLNGQAVGTEIENVNYAIKVSYLLSLYNSLPDAPKLSGTSTVAAKELQDQVKVLKNYVCLIKVY